MPLDMNITAEDRFFTNSDKVLSFAVKQSDGESVQDISGWSLSWVLKKYRTTPDASALVSKTGSDITITNGPLGLCELTVEDEDTADIPAGLYVHELKRIDAGAETPLCEGTAVLLQSAHVS